MLAAAAAVTLAASPAWAQGSGTSSSTSTSTSSSTNGKTVTHSSSSHNSHRDQDDARAALRQGKVMPLTAILEIAFKREKGTVLEVELETENGALTYEIELLSDSGRKVRMWINARTGEVLKVRHP